jgi:predicted lipoprotein with Yx(FWY)xxD motif
MRDSYRLRSMLAAAGVVVILAGCAQSGGGTTTPAPTQVAAAPSEAAQGSPEVYTVALANNPNLGMILTGDDGKTLYVFNKDSNGTTACTGACVTTWPPFTLDDGETAVAGSGVTGTIGTFQRPDGSTQVTINGKPLYYFSGDKSAGDANGEGFNNLWYAAGADGSAVQAPTPSATAGGYHY